MSKFKICIVDDQAIFRAGIKQALVLMKTKFECVELANCTQLLTQLDRLHPEIIIMNLEFTDSGISITEQLIKNNPDIKILLFADHANDELLIKLIDNGLFGCLLRTVEPYELKLAIEMVLTNQCYFSPQLINRILMHRIVPNKNENKRNMHDTSLTIRELEIIRLLCKGLDQQQIAEKLFISPRTVDAHKANIMSKLEVKNTTGIILHAIKNHVIRMEELL
jgi:DNA-binding NarL/FixJ family response regulator